MSQEPRPLIAGIVITHGQLGAELLKTAESILGPQEHVQILSNEGTSLAAMMAALETAIAAHGDGPLVIFVDLAGGSCGSSCMAIAGMHRNVLTACGVNLPMFVEFLYHRGRVDLPELKERLLAKGRDGIFCTGWGEA